MSNVALFLLVLVGVGAFVGGVVLALLAMRGAPDGFEDQEGFHSGAKPPATRSKLAVPSGKNRS